KYYFKAGSAGSDLLFGFDQCKSYRLILLQPLPPAIKGIRLNAVLLAERGHALPARFLLTYQLVPIVPPGLPHIFKCATSGDELGRAVHEPLTMMSTHLRRMGCLHAANCAGIDMTARSMSPAVACPAVKF